MAELKILSGGNVLLYSCDFGDGIAIGFNSARDFVVMGQGDYAVYPFHSSMLRITCELIPCRREDLKTNETAFVTSASVPDPEDLSGYCKILEDGIIYIDDNILRESTADLSSFNWYKVKPLN